MSSETTAGDAAGNYTIVRTFTATDDANGAGHATITVQDKAPEFTFVPTTVGARMRCRWTTPRRGQLRRGDHRSV